MKHFVFFLFLIISANSYSQEWYLQTFELKLTNIKPDQLLDDCKFYIVEGSRTDGHHVMIDQKSSVLTFTYSTMGGEEASLIIEKENEKMIILFDNWELKNRSEFKKGVGVGAFQSGYFYKKGTKLVRLKENGKTVKNWVKWKENRAQEISIITRFQAKFNGYVSSILNYKNDSTPILDSLAEYTLVYQSGHSFKSRIHDYDSCYMDSLNIICVEEVTKFDQIFPNTFSFEKETNATDYVYTHLRSKPNLKLRAYHSSGPTVSDPIQGQPPLFSSSEVSIMSFNGGMFIIMNTKLIDYNSSPDKPTGISMTYFLERNEIN